jgi:AraC-like DNA-binding protein
MTVAGQVVRRQQVRVGDVGEARARIGALVAPHQLAVVGNGRGFQAHMEAVRCGPVAVSRLEYSAHVRLRPDELVDAYVVHRPLRGRLQVSSNHRRVELTSRVAAVAQPGELFQLDWPAGSPLQLVRLDEATLRAGLRHQLGEEPPERLRFDLDHDLNHDLAGPAWRRWWSLVADLAGHRVAGQGLVDHPLIGADVAHRVVAGLLEAAHHNYSSLLHEPVRLVSARRARAAMDYMRAHLDQPITIPDVAAAVGVGIRHLEAVFRNTAQTTPRRYLRQLRLEAARDELRHATVGQTSVTQTALRWGFSRLGEFAGLYRATFGESPSMTLRAGAVRAGAVRAGAVRAGAVRAGGR